MLYLLLLLIVLLVGYKVISGSKEKGTHFYVGEPWFTEITKGKKTIDVRTGNEEKAKESKGKEIILYNKGREVKVKISKAVHYETLEDLLKSEDASEIAPHIKTKTELKDALKLFFTDDRIKKSGGIIAFHIKLV